MIIRLIPMATSCGVLLICFVAMPVIAGNLGVNNAASATVFVHDIKQHRHSISMTEPCSAAYCESIIVDRNAKDIYIFRALSSCYRWTSLNHASAGRNNVVSLDFRLIHNEIFFPWIVAVFAINCPGHIYSWEVARIENVNVSHQSVCGVVAKREDSFGFNAQVSSLENPRVLKLAASNPRDDDGESCDGGSRDGGYLAVGTITEPPGDRIKRGRDLLISYGIGVLISLFIIVVMWWRGQRP